MFPISDSIRSNKIPIVTLAIIAANLFVFYRQLMAPNEAFIMEYALVPSAVNFLNPYTLIPFVTSIFLHGGFFHILSNMWFLWIFGDNVEAHVGRIKFAILYLVSGIIGNLAQFLINPASDIPMIGASGAVSGVLGSYLILFPGYKIKTFVILFFYITITEIPAILYIFYWFIIQLFSGIASLPITFATGGVAFWAHVGGFLSGIILTRRFKSKKDTGVIEGEIVG
jgi:membrane associated rhomboid family serine protease